MASSTTLRTPAFLAARADFSSRGRKTVKSTTRNSPMGIMLCSRIRPEIRLARFHSSEMDMQPPQVI